MKKKITAKSKDVGIIDEILKSAPVEDIHFVDRATELTEQIYRMLDAVGWNQKQLALSMNKSEAEISKILSGTHNFTLRMLSHIESVLGENIFFTHAGIQLAAERDGKKVSIVWSSVSKKEPIDWRYDETTLAKPVLSFEKSHAVAA